MTQDLRLRRINRIRTIQGSLAIEGNTLTEEKITAILDGKRVVAPPREVKEAHNALAVYDDLLQWQAHKEKDLLAAHRTLMLGLEVGCGRWCDVRRHSRAYGTTSRKGSPINVRVTRLAKKLAASSADHQLCFSL